MTTNQSTQLIKSPNTKKALAVLTRYAALERQLKEAEKEQAEATALIKEAMIENSVQRIDGDWGYITLAERTNYSAEDISQVPEEFTKPALDTTKVKAQHTLTGQLPVGVVESKTQYITKKFKVVE